MATFFSFNIFSTLHRAIALALDHVGSVGACCVPCITQGSVHMRMHARTVRYMHVYTDPTLPCPPHHHLVFRARVCTRTHMHVHMKACSTTQQHMGRWWWLWWLWWLWLLSGLASSAQRHRGGRPTSSLRLVSQWAKSRAQSAGRRVASALRRVVVVGRRLPLTPAGASTKPRISLYSSRSVNAVEPANVLLSPYRRVATYL